MVSIACNAEGLSSVNLTRVGNGHTLSTVRRRKMVCDERWLGVGQACVGFRECHHSLNHSVSCKPEPGLNITFVSHH